MWKNVVLCGFASGTSASIITWIMMECHIEKKYKNQNKTIKPYY